MSRRLPQDAGHGQKLTRKSEAAEEITPAAPPPARTPDFLLRSPPRRRGRREPRRRVFWLSRGGFPRSAGPK